ncbi:hypothetical protein ACIO3R_09760 [Streptomyces sp. NPDC087428]|uniref:hypothetical protein n=1 Tax=Streptomyces sp. NPDC087428 TaxID=3365788 RepID=UPI003821B77D
MEYDFGITALGNRFHMDWRHEGPDPAALVRGWAALVAVDEDGREEIRLLGRDVRLLLDSPLADAEIHALWRTAATYYPVGPGTAHGRAWLTGIERELRPVGGAVAAGVAPGVDRNEVHAVTRLAHALDQVDELPLEPVPVDVVRNAVIHVAEKVDDELAFRFLLHAYAAYGTPVPESRYGEFRRISESLGHGAFMLETIGYLVE